jgi:prevent-host-death family protein
MTRPRDRPELRQNAAKPFPTATIMVIMEGVMERADVAQLKARLSDYLARVQHGEEVLVLQRGKPIARIIPIDHSALSSDDDL